LARVVVLGLDGAEPSLIEKWRDELPNFREIMERGVYGRLKSVIPPLSCPAWNCMLTGKNPGKIGVFGFLNPYFVDGKVRFKSPSSQYLRTPIWRLISRRRRICLFNVPTTYPPKRINGVMVSGILTPTSAKNYTYPPRFAEVLDEVTGGYEKVPPPVELLSSGRDRFLRALDQHFMKKVKALKYLLELEEWDFFMGVLHPLDAVQHYFWHFMDVDHPLYNREEAKEYGDVIKNWYKKADALIGDILKIIGDDVYLILVSDHGHGPSYYNLYINDWLYEEGYLKLAGEKRVKLEPLIRALKGFLIKSLPDSWIKSISGILPRFIVNKIGEYSLERLGFEEMLQLIDWANTRVYALGELGAGRLYIPGIAREKREEIIARLTKDLQSFCSLKLEEKLGCRLDLRVFKKEDIYWGPYVNEAPDAVVLCEKTTIDNRLKFGKDILALANRTGEHQINGIFMATGPEITKEIIHDISILDILPTVLTLLEEPKPTDLDGKAINI